MTVNSNGDAVGWDDYYPFGSVMNGRSQISSADNRYKFTEKERDTETNYDYFGARYYDSRFGRWLQVDPLASRKSTVGGISTYYINGYDGKTEVVSHVPTGSDFTYNIRGNDLIGQVRVVGTTATRYYYLKDHLGNIRMTINSAGNAVSWDDYYPFRSVMPNRSQVNSATDNRYKFTGKERDTEKNYDYFGARYYDARIGRWLQVDPLASKYPGWSPYNYTLSNPLRLVDPDGRYSVEYTNQGLTFRQWTLNGAFQQLRREQIPILGNQAFAEREQINDPSFLPSSDEKILRSVGMVGDCISSGVFSSGIMLLGKSFQAMTTAFDIDGMINGSLSTQQNNLLIRDENVFGNILNTKVDYENFNKSESGVRLAVYGYTNNNLTLILNPYIREKMRKNGDDDQEIDKWWSDQVKKAYEDYDSEEQE